ncbi:FAD:protein FMN transferase [Uliginosibacterium sp. 31-16]|uniref:FAD:protein FMN transferase n=1 Tax=Uliginosibacterium sp. 31-16 TaxID=3068315 RepID=UPI00273F72D2|nr:FAD:protein FMN transferase [Uliginosibacterium sp. 31-16]MDP5238175.1 FAD:protein FMN transferase [Uliginosibacterium sp. 31-16]
MMANAPAARVLIPARLSPDFSTLDGDLRQLAGQCMGTSWSVRVVCPDDSRFARLEADISGILDTIETQMSHFRHDSDLCRFARLNAGEWLEMPAEFAHVMRAALEVAGLSNGAFDPAIAAAVDAWGFGARQAYTAPGFKPPATVTTQAHSGWRELVIDDNSRLLQPGGVSLNFAAIAKGFAVDALSEYLARLGLHNHLVEIGGELRGAGVKPDYQPWWVALESPETDCPLPATRIALHGLAVATSGDYRRRYHAGDRFVQHTIDPRTGAPVLHALSSVTVIHTECMLADAWATALMVLGAEEGLRLATRQGLCALLQWRDARSVWREAASPAFQELAP